MSESTKPCSRPGDTHSGTEGLTEGSGVKSSLNVGGAASSNGQKYEGATIHGLVAGFGLWGVVRAGDFVWVRLSEKDLGGVKRAF